MAKQSLCAVVESAMQRKSTWQTRMSDDVLAELGELRDRFHSGSLGSQPHLLARLTLEAGKDRGWKLPSEKVLAQWFRSHD